jgi:hypothetical protein
VLSEVHRSNMSKLGEDGRPLLREDGKVLKSHLYKPPNVCGVLVQQNCQEDPLLVAALDLLRDVEPSGLSAAALLKQLPGELRPKSAVALGKALSRFAGQGAPISYRRTNACGRAWIAA